MYLQTVLLGLTAAAHLAEGRPPQIPLVTPLGVVNIPTSHSPLAAVEKKLTDWVDGAWEMVEGWVGESVEDYLTEEPGIDKTIYGTLSSDPRFTRLVKAIDFEEDSKGWLDNNEGGFTFFAVPNEAIPERPEHHRHDLEDAISEDPFSSTLSASVHNPLSAAIRELEGVNALRDSDPEKERRKKIIKKILNTLLQYHTLPEQLNTEALSVNNTYPTGLRAQDGAFDGQPARVKIEATLLLKKKTLVVNSYAKVTEEVAASNGFIQVINHPLIPPLSALDILFLFPGQFSTLTSSIQKVNLTNFIQYTHKWRRPTDSAEESKSTLEGDAPTVTVFAPTNRAFARLPPRLKLFLFSPFGERVLKKLLAFHVVPDAAIFSDYYYNATEEDDASARALDDHPHPPPGAPPGPVFAWNTTAPTLLEKFPLSIQVLKWEAKVPIGPAFRTHFTVNNQTSVSYIDGVARNGAVQVVPQVLNPLHGKKRHGGHHDLSAFDDEDEEAEWAGWEDWLPRWANDN